MDAQRNSTQKTAVIDGKIPPEILQEIELFETEAQRFLREETHPEVFRRFRLLYGIYGQRQEGVQMVRLKIPFGGLNPTQLRTLADIADEYTPRRVAHITTRQNMQFHFVKLQRVGELLRRLAAVGLTTREACGNTVRNVTASPHTGVCPQEAFDVGPYALATFRFFVRNPVCENLPRKFKIAFSDCPQDSALTPIHDVGLIALKQRTDGKQVPGFRVTVGGGLGPSPRKPYLLEEFVPLQDYLRVCEAIIRVFNRHGNRKNRSKARMKFLLEKIGFETFYRLYRKEYEFILETRDPSAYAVPEPRELEPPTDRPLALKPGGNGNGNGNPKFSRWLASNVTPQKQEGYSIVQIRLVIGDITSSQLRALANLAEQYASGDIRTTIQQNLVLRWVRQSDLYPLFQALDREGLALPDAESIGDVLACPGTDSCALGITGSKGLGLKLTDMLSHSTDQVKDLEGISIKISSCSNSCAQHHIASIGLHGIAEKINGSYIPAYLLHLGARVDTEGVTFGIQFTLRFPAKRIPDLVEYLVSLYRSERREGEDFSHFAHRLGRAKLQELLKPFTTTPEDEEERKDFYYDWGEEDRYELRDNKRGECAGGVVDMMEQHFEDAKYELANARVLLDKNRPFDALTRADLGVVAGARALLVVEGVDPASDEGVLQAFRDKIVAKGIISSDLYGTYADQVEQVQAGKSLSQESAARYIRTAGEIAEACHTAFQKMDANLRMKGEAEKSEAAPAESKTSPPTPEEVHSEASVHMDLRGVKCPMNYVKAKLRMEMMDVGETIELLLDEGEPIENVPRSMKDDGQKVLEVQPVNGHYRLVVEKTK